MPQQPLGQMRTRVCGRTCGRDCLCRLAAQAMPVRGEAQAQSQVLASCRCCSSSRPAPSTSLTVRPRVCDCARTHTRTHFWLCLADGTPDFEVLLDGRMHQQEWCYDVTAPTAQLPLHQGLDMFILRVRGRRSPGSAGTLVFEARSSPAAAAQAAGPHHAPRAHHVVPAAAASTAVSVSSHAASMDRLVRGS